MRVPLPQPRPGLELQVVADMAQHLGPVPDTQQAAYQQARSVCQAPPQATRCLCCLYYGTHL